MSLIKQINEYMEAISAKLMGNVLLVKNLENKICKNKLETNDNDKFTHIPQIGEHNMFLNKNYTLQQLKEIVKHYNLKSTGNKPQLVSRVYSHLYLSKSVIKIQQVLRGNIQRKYDLLHGPAYKNRKLCVNATDFLSMEPLEDISHEQFFSFKDDRNFIYGFDILSIYNLIKSNKVDAVKNPYNSQIIDINIINNLASLLRVSRLLKIKICTRMSDATKEMPDKKTIELRALSLFQNIDALGYYSDVNWFLSLNRTYIMRFMRELMDIWSHRASLTMERKREICPPLGNPFIINVMHLQSLENMDEIRKNILVVLEKLVNSGIDNDSKYLGASYVLCALTLVNNDAATSLPWLYQSVAYM